MKKYLLLGLGKSNMAVAEDLLEQGIPFDIYEEKAEEPRHLLVEGNRLIRSISEINYTEYHTVIKSPGIPYSNPVFGYCSRYNLPVTNEVGYGLPFVKKPLIAITGTNGKTTTTSLIEYILTENDLKASAVGNIGNPFLVEARKGENILITELSSFQLRDFPALSFNPEVSVWLNISDAHLDYHKTFEDYYESKRNILINQSENNLLVFNEDDIQVKKAAELKKGRKKSFSMINKKADAYFDGEFLYISGLKYLHKSALGMKGYHNIQNALAGILAAMEFIPVDKIKASLCSFNGVEHRLEKVKANDIMEIYNDSKSTNLTAVKAALTAFEKPVVLLMGGLDRGNGYDEMSEEWSKVKKVVCFGESGEKIYRAARVHTEAVFIQDIEKAILYAKEEIDGGGILLFSPGCASWDQFKNFEERGRFFKELVS